MRLPQLQQSHKRQGPIGSCAEAPNRAVDALLKESALGGSASPLALHMFARRG